MCLLGAGVLRSSVELLRGPTQIAKALGSG